ncbi:MAG: citramalate synthase [Desulfotomaculales bacterium]
MKVVEVYDTTLRDGAQGEGVSFSIEDKIKITRRLDEMGFHFVEGGWPGSNPKDAEYFSRIRHESLRHARVAAFGSTRKAGVAPAEDANLQSIMAAGVPVATIFGKSWDFHVLQVLNTTLDENLAMIRDSVAFLRERGMEVIYDAEHYFDGYKANPDYALATIRAAADAGARTVVLCDTNGGSLPGEIREGVRAARRAVGVPLGIHCHNDGELAVANTLAAVEEGVVHIQGTVNGYGERCGNANLCSVIPNLTLKYGVRTIPPEKLARLTELSRYVSELANLHHDTRMPFVGASAFAHKGGVHVHAIMKHSRTYEHIPPEAVGNRRRVLVSELSGLSNLLYKYRELNLNLESEESRRLLAELKELEYQGYQFEGAEGSFELLLRRANEGYRLPFRLENLRVLVELRAGEPAYSEAIIKLRVNDEVVHTAAEGNGPVNALDNALRKALEQFYPAVREMQLTDYKVRVLNGEQGTEAVVRVLIETGDGERSWGTVGVSTNIIEASWQALVDSIAYGLLKRGVGGSA